MTSYLRGPGWRLGKPASVLFKMVRGGMVWMDKQDGRAVFRLAPFVVGIYEAQMERMDHELAHLVEDYMTHGGAAGDHATPAGPAPGGAGPGHAQIRVGAAI